MVQIGCLGDIIFQVSADTVRSLENIKWGGSANYAAHSRLAGDTLTEFTGLGPDTFSFDMTLLRELGVEPMTEIKKLWKYVRSHEAIPLSIGEHAYGRYRWNILSYEIQIKHTDRGGNISAAVVRVKMQEYLKK